MSVDEDRRFHLPRLAMKSTGGVILASKGCFLQRIVQKGETFSVDRTFNKLHDTQDDIIQIELSPDVDNVFLCAGRSIMRCSRSDLISSMDFVKSEQYIFNQKVSHVHFVDDCQNLVVVLSDSTILYVDCKEPSVSKLSVSASKSLEVMSAMCVGNTWDNCRVFVATYLGSMLQILPSKSNQPVTVYDGTPGMIFGAVVRKKNLFTIHDDRSLRVWDLNSVADAQSIVAEFAHKARPFSICMRETQNDTTIYTASNDRTIVRWTWDDSSKRVEMTGFVSLYFGTMRTILIHENFLIVGSDAGFLISVPLSSFSSPKCEMIELPPSVPPSIRSFSMGNKTFVIDQKGNVFNPAGLVVPLSESVRYFASSFLNKSVTKQTVLAWSEGLIADVTVSPPTHIRPQPATSKFVSVVPILDGFIASQNDDVLIDLDSSLNVRHYFHSKIARLSICKKGPFIANCAINYTGTTKTHLIIGCMSGHVLISSKKRDEAPNATELAVNSEMSRYFGSETVQDMRIENDHLYILGKAGYMITWRLYENEDGILAPMFIEKEPLSRCGTMDWPCKFIEGTGKCDSTKLYVVGFHSTSCVVVDLSTNLIVWRFDCGGGNRHWNIQIKDGICTFGYIRDENFYLASSILRLPQIIDDSPHCAKTVFIEKFHCFGNLYIITAGTDNKLVVSTYDEKGRVCVLIERTEPEGFVSGSLCSWISKEGACRGRLVVGLAKGRMVVWDVDFSLLDGKALLPLALSPYITLSASQLGVSGRLQIGAAKFNKDLHCVVADDASDSAIGFSINSDCSKTELARISSSDKAGFSKVSILNGYIVGASTNGYFYASNGKIMQSKKLSSCGLSAIHVISPVCDSMSKRILILLGDEAGSIHLVEIEVASKDDSQWNINKLDTMEYAHISTVTDVCLAQLPCGRVRTVSTSLDCEVYICDVIDNKLLNVSRMSTSVQDPSSIALLGCTSEETHLMVAGSGIEELRLRNYGEFS